MQQVPRFVRRRPTEQKDVRAEVEGKLNLALLTLCIYTQLLARVDCVVTFALLIRILPRDSKLSFKLFGWHVELT